MSTVTFPTIGGRVVRATGLTSCGEPNYGDATQVVSDGIVTIDVVANYKDGTEVSTENFAGRDCVYRDPEPELRNLGVSATLCKVDAGLYTLFTGMPGMYDPVTGELIGFRVNRGVRPTDVRVALELWSEAWDNSRECSDEGLDPFAYILWPFLQGGRVSDYTIEANNNVTFQVSGMLSKDNSLWQEGPYNVLLDDAGDPAALTDPVERLDHQIGPFRTFMAPPEPTVGLVPLDNPDNSIATGATAGSPGFWTPAGNARPYDLADLTGGSYTASPNTAWTSGQRVVLGDGSEANWNGTAWEAGRA